MHDANRHKYRDSPHAADVEAVYSHDGKRCDGMKSGMNIIRMSDGTTRKIVK